MTDHGPAREAAGWRRGETGRDRGDHAVTLPASAMAVLDKASEDLRRKPIVVIAKKSCAGGPSRPRLAARGAAGVGPGRASGPVEEDRERRQKEDEVKLLSDIMRARALTDAHAKGGGG